MLFDALAGVGDWTLTGNASPVAQIHFLSEPQLVGVGVALLSVGALLLLGSAFYQTATTYRDVILVLGGGFAGLGFDVLVFRVSDRRESNRKQSELLGHIQRLENEIARTAERRKLESRALAYRFGFRLAIWRLASPHITREDVLAEIRDGADELGIRSVLEETLVRQHPSTMRLGTMDSKETPPAEYRARFEAFREIESQVLRAVRVARGEPIERIVLCGCEIELLHWIDSRNVEFTREDWKDNLSASLEEMGLDRVLIRALETVFRPESAQFPEIRFLFIEFIYEIMDGLAFSGGPAAWFTRSSWAKERRELVDLLNLHPDISSREFQEGLVQLSCKYPS